MAKKKKATKRPAASRAKKRSAKPARKRAAAVRPPKKATHIELRGFREQLKSHVSTLGTSIHASAEPQPQLEETLKRLSRWLDDIEAICGPNMMVPLP